MSNLIIKIHLKINLRITIGVIIRTSRVTILIIEVYNYLKISEG